MSELLALGVSHKTAPVALRERLALPEGQRRGLPARAGRRTRAMSEAVAISTCNRTELYLVAARPGRGRERGAGARWPGRPASARPSWSGSIYALRNCDAARHLYRVACGLESMIVGEAEVQGQVKRAYERALDAGTTGPLTNRLFRAALATGKRVRTETAHRRAGTSSRVLGRGRRWRAQALGDLERPPRARASAPARRPS